MIKKSLLFLRISRRVRSFWRRSRRVAREMMGRGIVILARVRKTLAEYQLPLFNNNKAAKTYK